MSRLFSLASRGSVEGFLERYSADDARLVESSGRTLLMHALRNDDPRRASRSRAGCWTTVPMRPPRCRTPG